MILMFFLEMAPEQKNRKRGKAPPYKKEGGPREFNPKRFCHKCGKLVLGFVTSKVNYCGSCGENFKSQVLGMVDCKRCRNLVKGILSFFLEFCKVSIQSCLLYSNFFLS